jgi:hypothetical protein
MDFENVLPILIPVVVLVVLWTLLRHWILPFVLGFALAVALGPSARPMMANAWEAVANLGYAVFGAARDPDRPDRRERSPDDREQGNWRRSE